MEIYEVVNQILESKGMSKKHFVSKLLELEPRLKSTGEIPSMSLLYSYLNGSRELRVELIPYISEVLGVLEQELFGIDHTKIIQLLNNATRNINSREYEAVKQWTEKQFSTKNNRVEYTSSAEYNELISLLEYAPPVLIKNMISTLEDFKKSTLNINLVGN